MTVSIQPQANPTDPVSDIHRPLTADFVTFYSFKGGVGRSMALINVAGIMAGRGFRILVLDMDLEAPGLSFLLPPVLKKSQTDPIPGFVDLMCKVVSEPAQSDLFKLPAQSALDNYIHSYPIPEKLRTSPHGYLYIMPAGISDAGYQQRLEDLNLPGLYQDGTGQNLMLVFKQIILDSERFDFVFIDSRTGFSDEAGICTRDLADRVMVVSGLNNQNIQGTASFLRALRSATDGKKPVSVVLSPVPIGEDELREQRIEIAREEFSKAYGQELSLNLQIPYHPRLALTEEPYIFHSSQGYLHDAYYRIEEKLREGLGLILNRLIQDTTTAIGTGNFLLAQAKFKQLLKIDSDGSGRSAVSLYLLRVSQLVPDARPLYSEVIGALGEKDWHLLWNIAALLGTKEELSEQALNAWQRLLSWRPDDANALGSFAVFLADIRKDSGQAEQYFRRAIDANPHHANNLGNFAFFLYYAKNDHDQADLYYRRAIAVQPEHANNISNFAVFQMLIRKDYDQAEQLFRRAIDLDPNKATTIGSFAWFLDSIRRDHEQAERYFLRAIDVNPNDANLLGQFAIFLMKNKPEKAEHYFNQAIAADPNYSNNLGNFAGFLFAQGRMEEGSALLDRALAGTRKSPALLAELYFYSFAHRWEEDGRSLRLLKGVLEAGGRSPGWPLERNVKQAIAQGHPYSDLVASLADVIADKATVESLQAYPLWQATVAIPAQTN